MDVLDHFKRLFAHDAWANARVLEALAQASVAAEDRAARALAHVLGAKEIWLARLEGRATAGIAVFPTSPLDEIRAKREEVDARLWPAWLATLDAPGLDRVLAYHTLAGTPMESRVGDILTQLITHGSHHRGQIASHLRTAGHAPPPLDFILWARG